MGKARRSYVRSPAVPARLQRRYRLLLAVLSGALTGSAAARALGLSRVRVQTLLHRGLTGFVTALEPPRGRPGRPVPAGVEAQAQRVSRENTRLRTHLAQTGKLLALVSATLGARSRAPSRPRARASRTRPAGDDSDPGGRGAQLAQIQRGRRSGLSLAVAATVAGVSVRTARRWQGRAARQQPLVEPRRRAAPAPGVAPAVAALVRALRGSIGADALRRSVPGVSRREAAVLKAATLRELAVEHRQQLRRCRVTVPGVVRGLDGLAVTTPAGMRHVLIAADGAIPYRTTMALSAHYDTASVVRCLAHDLATHPPPLVYRLDRARCHDTAPVRALLGAHGVLVLHGPPHYPPYYGQLERQQREHRQWLDAGGPHSDDTLPDELAALQLAMNTLWRRRALAWRTPAELWAQRPPLTVDRVEFRHAVEARTAQLRTHHTIRHAPADLAERLALEQVLADYGWLHCELGGWC